MPACACYQVPASPADGSKRIVVDLTSIDDWDLVVEKVSKLTENPALGLTAQAEKNHVVTGKDRIDDVGHDGVFVAHYSREDRLSGLEFSDEVGPHFVLDCTALILCVTVRAGPEFSQRFRLHDLETPLSWNLSRERYTLNFLFVDPIRIEMLLR